MIKIGEYNELKVAKQKDFGIYLTDGETELLMPAKWVPERTNIGDTMNVFVYNDSADRLLATTISPMATANSFAYLEVKQVNEVGAFLDWGMEKDLLVPYREQNGEMREGRGYVVYVYVDEKTNRLAGSARLKRFLKTPTGDLHENDIVDLLIYAQTPLGFNAIVNNSYSGLIYKNEVFENIRVGDKTKGFVRVIREDGKIDLRLQKSGFEHTDQLKERILKLLQENNGTLKLGDSSSPEEIKAMLQVSKKAFKKAVGALYKERMVELTDHSILLKKQTM